MGAIGLTSFHTQGEVLRFPPQSGHIMQGTTAGAGAVTVDMFTDDTRNADPSFRSWLVFRVMGPCFVEFGAVNTIAATVANSWRMEQGESQEFIARASRDRYVSVIRDPSLATDVRFMWFYSDYRVFTLGG